MTTLTMTAAVILILHLAIRMMAKVMIRIRAVTAPAATRTMRTTLARKEMSLPRRITLMIRPVPKEGLLKTMTLTKTVTALDKLAGMIPTAMTVAMMQAVTARVAIMILPKR